MHYLSPARTMLQIPKRPEVPDDQRASGSVALRYEDVAQDGRVMLLAMPQAVGEVWRVVLGDRDKSIALRDQGVLPILTRLVIEGAGGPISVRKPLQAEGCYQLAHTVDASGAVDRILLNMWASLSGPKSRTHGPPPPGAGESIDVGQVFAEHIFTKPFGPPAERKVTALAVPGVPVVPPVRWTFAPLATIGEIPPGAVPLDREQIADTTRITFGLAHTDSNHHVNSLVYPRMFEDAALRRIGAIGRSTTGLLSRRVELGYRKPCFAGDRMRILLQLFELDGHLGAAGTWVPESDLEAKPHCWVRMQFG